MNILFQPHSDDCVLFSCFNAIRYRPRVVTVLCSVLQERVGISHGERAVEDANAMAILRCDLEQWPEPDNNPDWDAVEAMMRDLPRYTKDTIIAPAVEEGGHEQHNKVGELAREIYAEHPIIWYLTYRRGHGRSTGREVEFEPEWVSVKYRALACYASQIKEPSTRPWFIDDPIREYVA